MDMSVTVATSSDDQQLSKTETKPMPRAANASDLDAWLEKAEALGELKRITAHRAAYSEGYGFPFPLDCTVRANQKGTAAANLLFSCLE